MKRPQLSLVPSFYHKYIDLVEGDDLNGLLAKAKVMMPRFLAAIPDAKWSYRYAAGKWSINELVQHLIDTERIFAYRALCFSRGEAASLPSFDENSYAANSKAENRAKEQLIRELTAVQESTALLFDSFDEEQLEHEGIANNYPVSVRAIGFITVGHMLHHKNVLREKYLQ